MRAGLKDGKTILPLGDIEAVWTVSHRIAARRRSYFASANERISGSVKASSMLVFVDHELVPYGITDESSLGFRRSRLGRWQMPTFG